MTFKQAIDRLIKHNLKAFIKEKNNLYILQVEDKEIKLVHLRKIYDYKLNKNRHKFINSFIFNKIPNKFKVLLWSKYSTNFH